jgi:hypothetical protein
LFAAQWFAVGTAVEFARMVRERDVKKKIKTLPKPHTQDAGRVHSG